MDQERFFVKKGERRAKAKCKKVGIYWVGFRNSKFIYSLSILFFEDEGSTLRLRSAPA